MSAEGTYLAIDGGTTRTRVRLWHADRVIDECEAHVGARDVAADGEARPIEEALRVLIRTLRERNAVEPSAVVCSGMISSDVGLVNVPHVHAPVTLTDLALSLFRHDIVNVTELPLYFVPGVKTVADSVRWETVTKLDVMRGEEAEVTGLLSAVELTPTLAFFHCGSHHKLILVSDIHDNRPHLTGFRGYEATLMRSSTALTGELLAAIQQRTILASSVNDLDTVELDWDAVAEGARSARAAGFARAAFLVRVCETVAGFGRDSATSFLIGALADLDLQLIEHTDALDNDLVVYGGGVFPAVLSSLLEKAGARTVRRISPAMSEHVAALGAVRLLETFLAERGRTTG